MLCQQSHSAAVQCRPLHRGPHYATLCEQQMWWQHSAAEHGSSRTGTKTRGASREGQPAAGSGRRRQAAGRQLVADGGRQQAGRQAGLLGESRRDTAQLWRTRNRKLLLKLTRGTSIVMEFQALKIMGKAVEINVHLFINHQSGLQRNTFSKWSHIFLIH
jgi:hypothetical protein